MLKQVKINFFLLITFLAVFLFSGCEDKKDWVGFYYPDIERMNDESTWKIKKGLTSLEDCRNWVDNVYKDEDNFDYECGYGCRYEGSFYVCKETLQ